MDGSGRRRGTWQEQARHGEGAACIGVHLSFKIDQFDTITVRVDIEEMNGVERTGRAIVEDDAPGEAAGPCQRRVDVGNLSRRLKKQQLCPGEVTAPL